MGRFREYHSTPMNFHSSQIQPHRLPPRHPSSHKGDYGHLLVIGGNLGMGGAPILAAEAALLLGVGKISVATHAQHVPALLARLPEVMAHGVDRLSALMPLLSQASAVVVGPGLGRDGWAQQMLLAAADCGLPTLVDADALALAKGMKLFAGRENVCYTPHPGEAAGLLDMSVAEVQADRSRAIGALQRIWGGCWVLKGSDTLVLSGGNPIRVCSRGTAGMARAGMGDALAGIIGALLARAEAPGDAAALGVWIHAVAGEQAAQQRGIESMRVTDLLAAVPAILGRLQDAGLNE